MPGAHAVKRGGVLHVEHANGIGARQHERTGPADPVPQVLECHAAVTLPCSHSTATISPNTCGRVLVPGVPCSRPLRSVSNTAGSGDPSTIRRSRVSCASTATNSSCRRAAPDRAIDATSASSMAARWTAVATVIAGSRVRWPCPGTRPCCRPGTGHGRRRSPGGPTTPAVPRPRRRPAYTRSRENQQANSGSLHLDLGASTVEGAGPVGEPDHGDVRHVTAASDNRAVSRPEQAGPRTGRKTGAYRRVTTSPDGWVPRTAPQPDPTRHARPMGGCEQQRGCDRPRELARGLHVGSRHLGPRRRRRG